MKYRALKKNIKSGFHKLRDAFPRHTCLSDLPEEVLLCILSLVPVQRRATLRTVSQTWHRIFLDLGYQIEPSFVTTTGSLPIYVTKFRVKWNPAIPSQYFSRSDYDGASVRMILSELKYTALMQRRSEFVTSPPISTVRFLYIESYHAKGEQVDPWSMTGGVLRAATPLWRCYEGIRIGDLLDVYQSLRGAVGAVDAWRFALFVGFNTNLDTSRPGEKDAAQISSRESRIEICSSD